MIRLRNDTKDKTRACLIRTFDRSSGRPSHESNYDTIHILIAGPDTSGWRRRRFYRIRSFV